MTKQDTLRVMAVLRAAYPSYYTKMSREDLEAVVALWTEMLSDVSAESALIACKRIIGSRMDTYPPSIGEIRTEALRAGNQQSRDWLPDAEYNRKVISYLKSHGMLSEGHSAPLLEANHGA